jgi:3-hydroxyacyl-CoA dehydrogenase/enoyl-CoA hydratase/3-hydroxybutyryl-CoA epimerase/enoyl-CoA isomerase
LKGDAGLARGASDASDEEIVERTMLPMLIESSRCLEEGIVGSPVETDVALLYGLGFPPFLGGIFRWADARGVDTLVRAAERHRTLGALYAPTRQMNALAAQGRGFHAE